VFFSEVKKLSEKDQDILGSIILEELRFEQKWELLFSNNKLERITPKVSEEIV
jgi:hypothetical protein